VDQAIWVRNTGNVDILDMDIEMEIVGNSNTSYYTKDTTWSGIIHPNDSTMIMLPYAVPVEEFYNVEATASLACNPALASYKSNVRECVMMEDLMLDPQFVKPEAGIDTMGKALEITVKVINLYSNDYTDVIIRAEIEDVDSTQVLNGLIPHINGNDSVFFTFPKNTVPKLNSYCIKVYLKSEGVDNYPYNDTITMCRQAVADTVPVGITNSGMADVFTLGQNIPNPAKNTTMIGYSVPESGEVVFNVHSVSGQLLYTRVLQPEAGKHVIELDTKGYAAGVYFYSVEYRGQKIVKRMSVKN